MGHHQPSMRSKSSSYEDSYLNGSHNEESTEYDSGEEFINIAQEASRIPSRHYRQPTTAMMDGHFTHYEGYQNNTNINEHQHHHDQQQQYYDHEVYDHHPPNQNPHFHPGLEEEKVEEQSYYEDGETAFYTDTQHHHDDTIHFVDSETDQVFTFGTQGGSTHHQRTAVIADVDESSLYDDEHQQYHHHSPTSSCCRLCIV